jgi:hypothetical protein
VGGRDVKLRWGRRRISMVGGGGAVGGWVEGDGRMRKTRSAGVFAI